MALCHQKSWSGIVAGSDEKKCPYCAEVIKAEALKCRYCGEMLNQSREARQMKEAPKSGSSAGKIILWIVLTPILGLLGLMVLGAVISGTDSPEDKARKSAGLAIELCWKDVSDDLEERSTRRLIRSVCEKMESDYRQKYNRAP
ncbi:zinc ribbon domain-containing protein [Pseudomonas putida]|uniref:zinc ribbon domain-containing protein n=1 Tax=Pseudomonas putida TaxID=303 RepID=UPI0032E9CD72